MAEAMARLREEHRRLSALFQVLDRQLLELEKDAAPDFDVIDAVLHYCLDFPDTCHHPKEDLVYRALCRRDAEGAKLVGDIEAEHARLGEATRALAAAARKAREGAGDPNGGFREVLAGFLKFYRQHMQAEEQVLFPRAVKILTAADWAEIDAKVSDRADPLFGEKVERRFSALLDYIHALDRIDGDQG